MNPARMRFHSNSDPSSADHRDRILKKVGVARLEFAATYLIRKSFERMATSIERFAPATTANSE